MVKSYMKRCLSPSSGKWKLKPLRYHLIHVRKAIIKKTINKRWWGCGEKGPLCSACGEGNGTPPQDSCLENPMDGGAWWAAVHGVEKSRTRLSDYTFTFHFHTLEKEMATHSSVLAWRIPGTAEPGGLPSMGSHRVGHDWSDLAAAAGHRLCECKLVQPLWKTVWMFLRIWKIELPHDPAIPLLGIYLKKITLLQKIYTPPCSLQHYLQNPRCGNNLSVHQWMKGQRKCHTHTHEH